MFSKIIAKISSKARGYSTGLVVREPRSSIDSTNGERMALSQFSDHNNISNDETERSSPYERWNNPRINIWRVLAAYFSFVIVGAIDGAYGVLIHYIGEYYHLDYLSVSFILLSPVIGYVVAAFANNTIHVYLGQRGIAIMGPGLHTISFIAAFLHPPYPLLIVIYMLGGLGSGLVDAGWNAWIGAMAQSNGLMGLLHSFYGVGAALAPLIATTVIDRRGWQWYEFYYLMAPAAFVELCTSAAAFWSATGAKYQTLLRANSEIDTAAGEDEFQSPPVSEKKNMMLQVLSTRSTWLISLFIFVYAGIEISLADWIFSLLVDVRHESPFAGSMVTFGYWGGLTLGRILLGFLAASSKLGKHMSTVCVAMSGIMHLLFSLRTDLVASAIAASLLGFFLGPLFPEAVVMQTKLVHKSLHVPAVGFACALGSAGGCVFPFIIGAIARVKGIQVLLPIVAAMLALCLAFWIALPSPRIR